jgi:hypothetical protein
MLVKALRRVMWWITCSVVRQLASLASMLLITVAATLGNSAVKVWERPLAE